MVYIGCLKLTSLTKMPVVFARDMPQKTWGYCVVECELATRTIDESEVTLLSRDSNDFLMMRQPVLQVRFSQLDTITASLSNCF